MRLLPNYNIIWMNSLQTSATIRTMLSANNQFPILTKLITLLDNLENTIMFAYLGVLHNSVITSSKLTKQILYLSKVYDTNLKILHIIMNLPVYILFSMKMELFLQFRCQFYVKIFCKHNTLFLYLTKILLLYPTLLVSYSASKTISSRPPSGLN